MALAALAKRPRVRARHHRRRQARAVRCRDGGALGRLEELSVWVASCQNVCPPTQFERARVVVFAGDHGVARSGVSAFPPEVTAQMVANFQAGGAAINVLAGIAGASVRVVDIAVDADARAGTYNYVHDGVTTLGLVTPGDGPTSVDVKPDETGLALAHPRPGEPALQILQQRLHRVLRLITPLSYNRMRCPENGSA